MQHPLLNLGAIGFSPEQQALIQAQLSLNQAELYTGAQAGESGHPVWQLTDHTIANALLLNAQHISWTDKHDLRFHADAQHSDIVGLRLSELSMPYAISGKLTAQVAAIVPSAAPNTLLHDKRSVVHTLQYFEAMLRPLRTLFALGFHMTERESELDNAHVFHVDLNGQLQAIVDMPEQRVIVRDGLRPFDLEDSAWSPRPKSANSVPAGFIVWATEELAWVLGMHGQRCALPSRYFVKPIYFRRMPRVRARMLYPRHSALLELLGQQVWKFADLWAALGGSDEVLKRDLYALYLCQAITTTAHKASAALSSGGSGKDGPQTSRLDGSFDLPTMAGEF